MIFWILTVLIIGGWLVFVVFEWMYDWASGLLTLIAGGLLAGLLWFLLACGVPLGVAYLLGPNADARTDVGLKALGSDSSVEGHFYFLGGGYVDGKRVLSYIETNADGSFTPKQADGIDSKVYELDGVDPSLTVIEHVSNRWWLFPGDVPLFTKYEFTVPVGSVSEQFEVTP